jgi:predicted MFS family arabinose efflux permease
MLAHLLAFSRHRTARATGFIFVLQGFLFGTWSAMIPYVKQKFGFDDAQLGLALLAMPAGVILMNPFATAVLQRLGTARAALISLSAAATLFVLPLAAAQVWILATALFAAGAAFSSTNVAMNTCATSIEQAEGVRILSTCHGLWSSGAMGGSALGGMAVGFGATPFIYVAFVAVGVMTILTALRKPLQGVPDEKIPEAEQERGARFAMPNAALWGIIVLSVCTNLTEGAMADWAAVYMRERVQAPEVLVGWGFAAYAFFMASGRFLGDALIARYGPINCLRAGGILACAGLLSAVMWPSTAPVLAGFALVGAGVSVGAPILYGAASRVPGMAKGAGLATMNTFAMIGFLGGPALIGFVSQSFGLQAGFAIVACAALFWGLFSGKSLNWR